MDMNELVKTRTAVCSLYRELPPDEATLVAWSHGLISREEYEQLEAMYGRRFDE